MRHQVTASDHLCLPDALSFDFEFFVYSSIHLFLVHTYSMLSFMKWVCNMM